MTTESSALNGTSLSCPLKSRKHHRREVSKNGRCGGWESAVKCCRLGMMWLYSGLQQLCLPAPAQDGTGQISIRDREGVQETPPFSEEVLAVNVFGESHFPMI